MSINAQRPSTAGKRTERGYALLVVIFLLTVFLISTLAIAPNIITEGRREKEKEMIWRGKQYTRGVKLYYRKMGKFPTSLDDLTKPKLGSLRFMRQAYKDPMNKEDGSSGIGTPASALNGPGGPGQPGAFGQSGGIGQPNAGAQPGPNGTPPGGSASPANPPATTGTPVSADQSSTGSQAIPSGDTPTIIGGNIIGVGSKVNKSSIIVYDKAKNYRLFEFIWDPSKDSFGAGQPGLQTGTGLGQPLGQQPGLNPTNPPQNPPQNPPPPPQNPQP